MLGLDYDALIGADTPTREAENAPVTRQVTGGEADKGAEPTRPMELTLGLLLESMEAEQPITLHVKGGTLICEAGALARLLCCEAQCTAVKGLVIDDGALVIDMREAAV